MEPITIVLIVLCAVLIGIIIWLVVKKWATMTPEGKRELVDKGMQLVEYLKNAWSNDGKIDMAELKQIMTYLIGIIAYLGGTSESSVRMQTGTEELLKEKTEQTE